MQGVEMLLQPSTILEGSQQDGRMTAANPDDSLSDVSASLDKSRPGWLD